MIVKKILKPRRSRFATLRGRQLTPERIKKEGVKFITQEGYRKLKEKLKQYERKLAKIQKGKAEAAEVGGDLWHDNPAFEEIERLQMLYGSQIAEIKKQLREAEVLNETKLKLCPQEDKIIIGSQLKIKYPNGKISSIKIVGSGESDPDKGLIAYDTPFGKSLMGKKQSQKAVFTVNTKKTEIEISEIIN